MPKPCTTSAAATMPVMVTAMVVGCRLRGPMRRSRVFTSAQLSPGLFGLASQQPMQGAPDCTHQLRRLFHSVTPHRARVCGPLQPTGYRQ